MAYVGCIAGAILDRGLPGGLLEAGFAGVQVVDTGSGPERLRQGRGAIRLLLPGDAKVESGTLPIGASSCCGGSPCSPEAATVHGGLSSVLERYDVNEYAASVRIYAVKPK